MFADIAATVLTLLGAAATAAPSPTPSASPSALEHLAHDQPVLTTGIFLAVVTVTAIIIAMRWVSVPKADEDADATFSFSSPTWRVAQVLFVVVSFIAAFWHASIAKEGADSTTLAFLVFILAIIVIPVVSKISLPGGAAVELIKREVKADAVLLDDNARVALLGMASAARAIAETESALMLNLQAPTLLKADVAALIAQTLSSISGTVAEYLRPAPADPKDPREIIRISAWLAIRKKGQASTSSPGALTRFRFAFGWPETAAAQLNEYVLSVDPLGTAPFDRTFRDSFVGNYMALPPSQRPPVTEDAQTYCGILMVPLVGLGEAVGVMCIERVRPERFEPTAIALSRAIAAVYSAALSDPRLR